MKRILVGLIGLAMVVMLCVGCTGINANVATNIASDVTFATVMKNNPNLKAPVVKALQSTRDYLQTGGVTYDDLLVYISKQFAGQYAYVGVILSGYIETDKPIFQTYLPLLDSYKAAVTAKIDRFLVLAQL